MMVFAFVCVVDAKALNRFLDALKNKRNEET